MIGTGNFFLNLLGGRAGGEVDNPLPGTWTMSKCYICCLSLFALLTSCLFYFKSWVQCSAVAHSPKATNEVGKKVFALEMSTPRRALTAHPCGSWGAYLLASHPSRTARACRAQVLHAPTQLWTRLEDHRDEAPGPFTELTGFGSRAVMRS